MGRVVDVGAAVSPQQMIHAGVVADEDLLAQNHWSVEDRRPPKQVVVRCLESAGPLVECSLLQEVPVVAVGGGGVLVVDPEVVLLLLLVQWYHHP
jgi:hypothetical protein